MIELFRALGALAERPRPEHGRIAEAVGLPGPPDAAEHTDLFGFQLYPYASVYLGSEGMLGGEARDRIAGFWSAIGELPPAEPDHLTVLLALLATIHEREREIADEPGKRILRHARHAFFWEHIGSWVFAYLGHAREIGSPFYRAWADTLHRALIDEATALGHARELPLHLRAAPGLPAPDETTAARFADTLLAPVRSGIILTRADLARLAEDLGVGVRMGERRTALQQLIAADPSAVRDRLAREARRQADRHRAEPAVLALVGAFWTDRAEAAARALAPDS